MTPNNAQSTYTVKELRTKYDLSQTEFALLFNIPKRTVQYWEQTNNQTPYILLLINMYFEELEARCEATGDSISDEIQELLFIRGI